MSRGKFCEHFFSNTKLIWKLSLRFEPRISSFWDLSDSFGRFDKIAFYVSIGSFEGHFFLKNGFFPPRVRTCRGKILELWLTFDRQGCHNKNLSAQRNFMTNNTYFENNWFLYKWLRCVTGNCFGRLSTKFGRAVKSADYASR